MYMYVSQPSPGASDIIALLCPGMGGLSSGLYKAGQSVSTCIYCTLIEPLCSISHKAKRPISSDIGWLDEQTGHKFMIMGAWCTIYNKFLIGWVAIQYHWTLDSSCLYLARPSDSAKYCTDSSNCT